MLNEEKIDKSDIKKSPTNDNKAKSVGSDNKAALARNNKANSSSKKNTNTAKNSKKSNTIKNATTNKKRKNKKHKDNTTSVLLGLTMISLVMVMAVVGQFFLMENTDNNRVLSKGTYINGYNISGMSGNDAVEYLTAVFKENSQNFMLTLTHKDNKWTFNKNDFTVNSNIHTIVEMSQLRDKQYSNYEQQVDYINKTEKDEKSLNIAFNYIFTGLDEKIDNVIKQIEIEPIDSVVTFNPDANNMFEISDSVKGLKVDKTLLYKKINDEFLKTNNIVVEVPTLEIDSEITKEYNQQLTTCISTFSTNVADSTGGRKSNVKLALSKFNGMRIENGESVSFNKITGPHSLDNGYKMATVIYNSQFVEGVGGGICQASTTLYNALLNAGIKIDEVNKHTLPVKYVPLALDAMVAEYISDLKFTNNTGYPLFIKTYSDENSVFVEIYSHENPNGYTYKARGEQIKVLPHNGDVIKKDSNKEYTDKVLFEGEYYRLSYPREGYEAKSYLQTFKDGKMIEEKEIRHEIYKPQNGIIIEGVEALPSDMAAIESDVKIIKSENMNNESIIIDNMHGALPTAICP